MIYSCLVGRMAFVLVRAKVTQATTNGAEGGMSWHLRLRVTAPAGSISPVCRLARGCFCLVNQLSREKTLRCSVPRRLRCRPTETTNFVVVLKRRSRHHEHIPQLTLKERELQRLKREQELKESGLTGERGVHVDKCQVLATIQSLALCSHPIE